MEAIQQENLSILLQSFLMQNIYQSCEAGIKLRLENVMIKMVAMNIQLFAVYTYMYYEADIHKIYCLFLSLTRA